MLRITLESEYGVLPLDEISQTGEGVEVLSGLTGLGLPPVDVQWREGVGDGAVAGHTRALPRDIDLPLAVFENSRAALKQKLSMISRVMSSPMIMKIHDTEDGHFWWAEVRRTGGGTIAYGVDTDGEHEWQSVVSLRAGSPYLTSSVASVASVELSTVGAGRVVETLTIGNDGDAPSPPVITATGPLNYVGVADTTNPSDLRKWEWRGNLNRGETIQLDIERGTLLDGSGVNRYGGLGAAPNLFNVRPGVSQIEVTLEREALIAERRNYIDVPIHAIGQYHGWSPYGSVSYEAHHGINVNGWFSVGLGGIITPVPDDGLRPQAVKYINFPANKIGTRMTFSASLASYSDWMLEHPRLELSAGVGTAYQQALGYQVTSAAATSRPFNNAYYEINRVSWDFTVPPSARMEIALVAGRHLGQTGVSAWSEVAIQNLFVGEPGYFFTGDTPDTATSTHSWAGTPNQSASICTYPAPDPILGPGGDLELLFAPREWMVV